MREKLTINTLCENIYKFNVQTLFDHLFTVRVWVNRGEDPILLDTSEYKDRTSNYLEELSAKVMQNMVQKMDVNMKLIPLIAEFVLDLPNVNAVEVKAIFANGEETGVVLYKDWP